MDLVQLVNHCIACRRGGEVRVCHPIFRLILEEVVPTPITIERSLSAVVADDVLQVCHPQNIDLPGLLIGLDLSCQV
jgi:hypothetical protein